MKCQIHTLDEDSSICHFSFILFLTVICKKTCYLHIFALKWIYHSFWRLRYTCQQWETYTTTNISNKWSWMCFVLMKWPGVSGMLGLRNETYVVEPWARKHWHYISPVFQPSLWCCPTILWRTGCTWASSRDPKAWQLHLRKGWLLIDSSCQNCETRW